MAAPTAARPKISIIPGLSSPLRFAAFPLTDLEYPNQEGGLDLSLNGTKPPISVLLQQILCIFSRQTGYTFSKTYDTIISIEL